MAGLSADEKQLRDYLRENLEIVIDWEAPFSPGNNQKVGLKFKDEDKCFTKQTVYIPDED